MKRFLALVMTMIVLMSVPIGGFSSGLTIIGDEAFAGDASLQGTVVIPSGVVEIGTDAFSQTGVFALEIPADTVCVGPQALLKAVYVRLHGSATTLEGLSGVEYIIAPQGSTAQAFAQANGLDFVAQSQLVEADGFLYQQVDGTLKLLSAKDATLVGETVSIPAQVNGMMVTGISDYAFICCTQMQQISLPEALQALVTEEMLADCPNVTVEYKKDGLYVESVTATVEPGAMGEAITWSVETQSQHPVAQYIYTLCLNGQGIQTVESQSNQFSCTASEPGAYQLYVTVADTQGNTSTGVSSALYIAVEAMKMTVPSAIANGQDLVIDVEEVTGANRYSVYLTNEETGEFIGFRTLSKAGKVTFSGYMLDAATYRVSGYAHGNNFRYTVPTVKKVTVAGQKAAGPAVPAIDPIHYEPWKSFEFCLEGEETVARYWFCYSDGTTSAVSTTGIYEGDSIWIGMDEYEEKWTEGGAVLIQGAAKHNGTWTDWGEIAEVTVLPADRLEAPAITAPAALAAGTDCTISFSSVEDAERYCLWLFEGEVEDIYRQELYFEIYRSGQTITIPGYYFAEGIYTIIMRAESEKDGYRESPNSLCKITVTGSRPAAPAVTADKTEVYLSNDSVVLTVSAPGAEGALIMREAGINGEMIASWGDVTISLDENGYGIHRHSINSNNDERDGYTLRYQVYAIIDGVWSEMGSTELLMKKRDPLAQTVITVPESIQAGQDLTFSFAPVENADSYCAYLYRSYGNSSIASWYEDSAMPDQLLTLAGHYLTQGNYRLQVVANSSEFGTSTTEAMFKVTGTRPSAPAVVVDRTHVVRQEEFTFEIDAAGAEALVYKYTAADRGSSTGNINVLETPVRWSDYQYWDDLYTYSFAMLKDGYWSAWSTPIEITVTNEKTLAAPTVTMPASLALGEDLTVAVGAVDGARNYYVYLYNSRGVQLNYQTLSGSAGGTVTFGGYRLSQGTYKVKVEVKGTSASSTAERSVTVTSGTRPNAPAAVAETELGRVNVYYSFSIPTAGVDRVAVRYYRDGAPNDVTYKTIEATGDITTWRDSKGAADQTWNYAFAVQTSGKWSGWSTTHKVTITNREQLAKAVVMLPESVEAGEDVYISFSAVENADSYTLYLYAPDNSSSSWTAYPDTQRRVDGYSLNPGTYRVVVRASGAEYETSMSEKTFVVSGTRSAAPVVTVDKNAVLTDESFFFVILTNGGEEVAYRYTTSGGGSSSGKLNVPSDPVVWETSSGSDGVRQYSFCTIRSGKWSAWSEPVEIQITERPVLPEPVVTVPQTIRLGEDLLVEVGAVEGASRYDIDVYNNRNELISSRYLYTAGTAVIPGYRLPAGAIRIQVEANGADNGNSKVDKTAVVLSTEQPSAPAVILPEDTTVDVQTSFTFHIETKGADRAVMRYYRVGAPNSVTYSEFSVAGNESTAWQDSWSSGGRTYAYSFAVQKNGVWSKWSPYAEMTINPNPVLPEPEAAVPQAIELGEDLSVEVAETKGASYYYVYVYNSRGEQLAYRYLSEPGTAVIPGYRLAAGTLRVQVEAYGSNSSSKVNCDVEVLGTVQPDAPAVTPPASTSMPAQSSVIFTIAAQGAEKAVVRYYRVGQPNDMYYSEFNVNAGTSTTWKNYLYNSGSIYSYSFAVQKNGVWSLWSAYTDIEVTAAQ